AKGPHLHVTPVYHHFAHGRAFMYVWPEKDFLRCFEYRGDRFEPKGIGVFSFPGSALAAAKQTEQQLDVVTADCTGALNVLWRVPAGAWIGPTRIGDRDLVPPGAPVALCKQTDHQLVAVAVDLDGDLAAGWVGDTGVWVAPHKLPRRQKPFPPGAPVALCKQA